MNASFSSKIPDVPLDPIAASDPLWPPNLVPHAVSAHALTIPANAGKRIDDLMLGKK
jgi:hypothetical protein